MSLIILVSSLSYLWVFLCSYQKFEVSLPPLASESLIYILGTSLKLPFRKGTLHSISSIKYLLKGIIGRLQARSPHPCQRALCTSSSTMMKWNLHSPQNLRRSVDYSIQHLEAQRRLVFSRPHEWTPKSPSRMQCGHFLISRKRESSNTLG